MLHVKYKYNYGKSSKRMRSNWKILTLSLSLGK